MVICSIEGGNTKILQFLSFSAYMGVLDLTEALKITNSSPLNKSYHPSELPQFLHLENESLNEVETTFPSVLQFYVYMILLRVQRGRNQCIDYLQCRE